MGNITWKAVGGLSGGLATLLILQAYLDHSPFSLYASLVGAAAIVGAAIGHWFDVRGREPAVGNGARESKE